MNKQIKVSGRHCAACKNLIEIELADNNLKDKLQSSSINEKEKNDLVGLQNVTEPVVEQIIKTINKLEGYSVIN